MLNIEKGCQAMVVNSRFGNNGKIVTVIEFVGKLENFRGNDRWRLDKNFITDGGMIDCLREFQLMRIDGYKEETKLKEVEHD